MALGQTRPGNVSVCVFALVDKLELDVVTFLATVVVTVVVPAVIYFIRRDAETNRCRARVDFLDASVEELREQMSEVSKGVSTVLQRLARIEAVAALISKSVTNERNEQKAD